MRIGTELKHARERAGLSIEQIAEITKIQVHKLEALEADDCDSLPTGIYLEGIVRAYAHEVAIDPLPLIDRIRGEHSQPADVWTPPIVLNAVQDETRVHAMEDIELFPTEDIDLPTEDDIDDFPSEADLAPASPHATFPRAPRKTELLRAMKQDDVPRLPRELEFARPIRQDDLPRAPRELELARPMTLVLAAVVVAVGLSQATNLFESDESPGAIFSVPAPTKNSPPFSATNVQPATAVAKPDTESSSVTPNLPDVSGTWVLNTRVESTSYSRYAGLQLGYQIDLQRDGNRVTGEGRKVTENGRKISSKAQTPITVDGEVEGDRMTLAFTERGVRRPTHGTFNLQVVKDDALDGRFSSTAARSAGAVAAKRISR